MKQVLIRPKAEDDLVNLWRYIAQHADPDTASRYLHALDAQLTKLSEFPEMGRSQDRLYPKLRSFVIDRLILFYLPSEHGIDLIRVIAAAQDIERIVEDGGF